MKYVVSQIRLVPFIKPLGNVQAGQSEKNDFYFKILTTT